MDTGIAGASVVSGGLAGSRRNQGTERIHQFKWNQQESRVLQQLRALYGSGGAQGLGGAGTDVILISGDGQCVEAHKLVLGLCSPYFQELFAQVSQVQSQRGKEGAAVVVLKSVTGSMLKFLIQFIYTGEVALPSGAMEEFLEIGNEFQIEGITYSSSSTAKATGAGASQVPKETQNLSRGNVDSRLTDKPKNPEVSSFSTVSVSPAPPPSQSLEEEDDTSASFDSYPIPKVESLSTVNFIDEGDDDQMISVSGDEDKDPDFEPSSSSRRKRPRRKSSTKTSKPEKRKYDWVVQDPVADDIIQMNWRKRFSSEPGQPLCFEYYCPLGINGSYTCPARIKMKTLIDGTVVWMNNGMPHSPHGKQGRVWGLSQQQKDVVMECIKNQMFKPSDILLKIQLSGLPAVTAAQLGQWMSTCRNKHPELFASALPHQRSRWKKTGEGRTEQQQTLNADPLADQAPSGHPGNQEMDQYPYFHSS